MLCKISFHVDSLLLDFKLHVAVLDVASLFERQYLSVNYTCESESLWNFPIPSLKVSRNLNKRYLHRRSSSHVISANQRKCQHVAMINLLVRNPRFALFCTGFQQGRLLSSLYLLYIVGIRMIYRMISVVFTNLHNLRMYWKLKLQIK